MGQRFGVAYKQEINVPLVVTIGAVSGFLLITLVIGVQAWYLSEEQAEIESKADSSPVQELVDAKEQQKHLSDAPHWADKDHKTLVIPIEQAMAIIVQNNGVLPTTQPASGPATQPSAGMN
jgi:hypothetical protein